MYLLIKRLLDIAVSLIAIILLLPIFIPIIIFIITAVSNGANLTDGIDGLAAGTSAIIAITLAIFAWVSGNIIFADYLNVMYIPNSGEITIFISAFVGGLVGFLWYNTYPAQVFMGDTGSLTIGGIIAVLAISVRKELLIPILAGMKMENFPDLNPTKRSLIHIILFLKHL